MEGGLLTLKNVAFGVALVAALGLAFASLPMSTARAQETSQVSASAKGIIGLGLIGAEIGFVVPALAGLDETWAFIVFPVLGATGGSLAGYFLLENGDGHPEAAVATLAIGMGLIVPTMVLTLSLTAYDPSDDEAAASDGAPMGAEAEPAPVAPPAAEPTASAGEIGDGIVRVNPRGVFLGAPAMGPVATYSSEEVRRYGLTQRSEMRVSLFSATF